MRLAIIWEQYSWGGVDTHTQVLTDFLSSKNVQIDLIVNHENDGVKRIANQLQNIANLEVKYIPIWSQAVLVKKYPNNYFIRAMGFLCFPIFLIQNFITLFRVLNNNYDVLLAQNGSYPGGWSCLVSVIVAKIKGIRKRLLVIHHSSSSKRLIWYFLELVIDKLVYSYAHHVITVSKASLQSYLELRKINNRLGKCIVVYNGIPLDFERKALPLFLVDKVKVGIVGRCEERKGHLDFIDAISLLTTEIKSKCQFYIIGSCEESFKNILVRKIDSLNLNEFISITGYLENPSQEIIGNLDILCCLTRDYEGFGLTVLEAMSKGTCVITTDVGALSEFVSDGVNSMIVQPKSPRDIANKIQFYFNRKPLEIKVMQEAALETAKKFSKEAMGKEFSNLIMKET